MAAYLVRTAVAGRERRLLSPPTPASAKQRGTPYGTENRGVVLAGDLEIVIPELGHTEAHAYADVGAACALIPSPPRGNSPSES